MGLTKTLFRGVSSKASRFFWMSRNRMNSTGAQLRNGFMLRTPMDLDLGLCLVWFGLVWFEYYLAADNMSGATLFTFVELLACL